jgi:hypothetical protein
VGLLVFSLVVSVAYAFWAARRVRRTVLASDENSYTLRFEWIRKNRSPDDSSTPP